MRRAIMLARRGEGRVEPNPMVGCVITRGGRIIGEGHHRGFGRPHAEVEALRRCHGDPRGARVYVSLEPCCHQGKTPPCSAALIEAGVGETVVGTIDPNPLVGGRGVQRLRRAGIAVRVGVCKREAAALIAPYATRLRLYRPYVIAKWAQSLDGKLATHRGESRWISSGASRRQVHRLRARVDAVLVGCSTVRADDPLLVAREVPLRRRAMRVVLDGRLRIPERCRLVGTAGAYPTLVMTTSARARSPKADRLRRRGVEIVRLRGRRGRLALYDVLATLARRDVTNLLAEGGPAVLTRLFDDDLVDEAHVYVAPILVGGTTAPGPLGGLGAARLTEAIHPHSVSARRCGCDTVYRLKIHPGVPESASSPRPLRSRNRRASPPTGKDGPARRP